MKDKKLKITGMTCSACANRVEKVVGKLDGVESANVNFATETLSVKYDDKKVDNSEIEKVIEKAGYGVQKNLKSYNLKVEGMTCSACANRVERVTKKADGVMSSSVNFATEKLNITFDEDKINIYKIKEIVQKSGYNLVIDEKKDIAEKKIPEYKKLWYRFILSIIFTVPLLIVSMGHMVGMHLPEIIDPMMNPMNFAITQLILTIPVMLFGYRFYIIGFKNLFKLSPNMDSLIAIGTSAAVIYGFFAIYKIATGNHDYAMHLYFESAAVILTLITL